MFLHLARASVSQYTVTVGQRQAAGQAGTARLRILAPSCWSGQGTRLAPEALSRGLASGESPGPTEAE